MKHLSNNSLQRVLDEDRSRLLLQQQIAKDFATSGIDFPPDFQQEVFKKELLFASVQEKLIQQLEKGERQTLALLYTIDISEKAFLESTQVANFAEHLTYLIIEREAQKVYFRTKGF